MPQYLVAIHHPDDFDPAPTEDEAARHRDIAALNREMVAAGIRVFVGGPYVETKEHIGGFWVLEVADLDAALEWGRKAAIACRAPTEVRPFH
jgi:hypothetical protein